MDSFERELVDGGRVGDLVGDEGMEGREPASHLSLHDALQDLPERDRQVLSLRYSRDLTQQQVSRIVGVSQGAGLAHRKRCHREAEGNAERVKKEFS